MSTEVAMDSISASLGTCDAPSSGVVDLSPACPWRPVDWRLRLARLRARGELQGRGLDDAWVRRAARFHRESARRGREFAAGRDAGLAAALHLLDDVRGRDRLAVECLLLAGLGDGEVATRLGLPADVIAAYAALFFDVRPLLASPDRIVLTGVDPSASLHTGTAGPEVIARLLSFNGGPLVAAAVLDLLAGGSSPSATAGIGAGRGADIAAGLRTLFTLHATPVDERSAPMFLRLHARLREIEAAESDRSTSPLHVPVVAASRVDISPIVPKSARENATDVPPEGLAADGREGMMVDPSSSMAAEASPGSRRERLRRAI
jgi:hypothetical protein